LRKLLACVRQVLKVILDRLESRETKGNKEFLVNEEKRAAREALVIFQIVLQKRWTAVE
jgi:hypothetical protein